MPINPMFQSYKTPVAYQLAKLVLQGGSVGAGLAQAAIKASRKPRSDKGKTRFTKAQRSAQKAYAAKPKSSSLFLKGGGKKRYIRPSGAGRKLGGKTRKVAIRRTKLRKRYPQKLTQVYSLCSASCFEDLTAENDSIPTGTIKNKDDIYSIPAGGSAGAGFTNSSIILLNIANTESHWYQGRAATSTGPGGATAYRTGTQLCGQANGIPGVPNTSTTVTENDSFIWKTSTNNSAITSVSSPFFQNGIAENAVDYVHQSQSSIAAPLYIVPNSTLDYLKVDITVFNPQISPQTFNLKIVRANTKEAIETATFGDNSTKASNNLKIMCNSIKFTNPQQYSTLYSKTINMPGLRAGQKLKNYRITKALSLKYLRTQYRKKFSAEDMDTFGEQASSTYSFEPGFFNSVYVILSSVQQDEKYVSNVSVNRYDNTGADPQMNAANLLGQEHLPQLTLNINTGNSPGVSGRSAGLPPGTMGGRYIPCPVGPQFGIRGSSTVKVVHSVESIRRSVPLTTSVELTSLQDQINDLTALVGVLSTDHDEDMEELKDDHTDHVHEVEHPQGNWIVDTSTPNP